ncbi:MAG: NAD regulator [Hyphomicrobiaceae bacterium]
MSPHDSGSSKPNPASPASAVEIGLTAAILAVRDSEPMVLVVRGAAALAHSDALPFGPFSPLNHRTLDIGLRAGVAAQTGLELGYVEQLYTFGDRGRHAQPGDTGPHVVSIGYLALRQCCEEPGERNQWRSWYDYFPWEDRRDGPAEVLDHDIIPRLNAWARAPVDPHGPIRPIGRAERVRMCFGTDGGDSPTGSTSGSTCGSTWDEEKVLERYELMYEAGLAAEAQRDGRLSLDAGRMPVGAAMQYDHRRILATAIGRIRGKIKYRPVIFELLPDEFTLYELQRTVEAILGPHLHKQNFRRLVESGGLVEPTGVVKAATGGRPAKMYRFRRDVLLERPSPGVRVKPGRS